MLVSVAVELVCNTQQWNSGLRAIVCSTKGTGKYVNLLRFYDFKPFSWIIILDLCDGNDSCSKRFSVIWTQLTMFPVTVFAFCMQMTF